jgi:hypothetical protein
VSRTKWELQRTLSSRLRSIWDTKRDGVATWEQSFEAARADLAAAMERDASLVRAMTWEWFKRQEFGVDAPQEHDRG